MPRRLITVLSILWVSSVCHYAVAQQIKEPSVPVNIRVFDASGAPIGGACVHVIGPTKDDRFSEETDSQGRFPAVLRPGGYEVTSVYPGFAKTTTHFQLEKNFPASIEVKMPIASCSPCVEVRAVAPLFKFDPETGLPQANSSLPQSCEGCDCKF
jgi:hypothetical protein